MEKALEVLAGIETNEKSRNGTQEEKRLDYDLGLLCVTDTNPLDEQAMKDSSDTYLLDVATQNVRLLMRRLHTLPTELVEGVRVHKLPEINLRLPREKPVPKPKPPTKWEQYARSKGLSLRAKGKKVWDKELKRWVPRFGGKRVQADREKNWVREVPAGAEDSTDMFAKAAHDKRERIAKNELSRLRNIKRAGRAPRVGVMPNHPSQHNTDQLKEAAIVARASTSSLGRHARRLPHDVPVSARGGYKQQQRSRQLTTAAGDTRAELAAQINVLNSVARRAAGAVVDTNKAANRLIYEQQTEQHAENAKKKRPAHKKKQWIPNTKKGDKQRKAIAKKNFGKNNSKGRRR